MAGGAGRTAGCDRLELAAWLVERGVRLDATDVDGVMLLEEAVGGGHIEMAAWLVDRGARLDARDRLLLYEAVGGGHVEMAAWLVDRGARLDVTDSSLLFLVVKGDHVEMAAWLVERGARLDAIGMSGRTLLHEAAAGGHVEMATWLVERGARLDAKDRDGKTPLSVSIIAAAHNRPRKATHILLWIMASRGLAVPHDATDGRYRCCVEVERQNDMRAAMAARRLHVRALAVSSREKKKKGKRARERPRTGPYGMADLAAPQLNLEGGRERLFPSCAMASRGLAVSHDDTTDGR